MAQRLTIHYNQKPCYDIVFAQDFGGLAEELEGMNLSERRVCIITDSVVEALYAQEVLDCIREKCRKAVVFPFQPGNRAKRWIP